jgi:hypothetical protein
MSLQQVSDNCGVSYCSSAVRRIDMIPSGPRTKCSFMQCKIDILQICNSLVVEKYEEKWLKLSETDGDQLKGVPTASRSISYVFMPLYFRRSFAFNLRFHINGF